MNRGLRAQSIALALLLAFASSAPAQEADLEASRADRIASAIYFEGVPIEEIRDLTDEDVARLIELLGDPDEIRNHPNILVALGWSGSPAAFDAISDYALRSSSGELDRLQFRALRSIAPAMGHLARVDGRALAWLIRAANDSNAPEIQSFRQLGPERIARLKREGAITGLGLSGQPTAARVLAGIVSRSGADPRTVEHCSDALALNAEIFREGPDSALRDAFGAAQ